MTLDELDFWVNQANGGLEGSTYLRVLLGDGSPEGVADITATFSKSLGIAGKDFVKFIIRFFNLRISNFLSKIWSYFL